jgi:hypothetical protein
MGLFVSFVEYMPARPIKQGIKVYALCCAYTGHLYRIEIYTGRGGTPDSLQKGVISRLTFEAGATGTSGRIEDKNSEMEILRERTLYDLYGFDDNDEVNIETLVPYEIISLLGSFIFLYLMSRKERSTLSKARAFPLAIC